MADEQLLTVDDVAQRLQVNPTTVYRLVRQGRLPGFKVGDQWRFSQEMLDGWMTDQVTLHILRTEDQRDGSSPVGEAD